MSQAPTKLRPVRESDESFIYSTWLKSYRQTDWAKHMSNDVFFLHHKQIIKGILSSPWAEVTMIHNPDDPDHLMGYVVAERVSDKVLMHFCYVKYNYRKLGIMKNAFKELGYFTDSLNFITHLPRHYAKLKERYNLEYNPYLLKETE